MGYTGDKKREYQLKWVRARRDKAIELKGSRCRYCGSSDRLEFDHIDPGLKETYISRIWSYSWENILKELEKCQLLCYDCHQEKTNPGVPHGINTTHYKRGCRCKPCKNAKAKEYLKYKGL